MKVPTKEMYSADPNDKTFDAIPYWLVNTTPDSAGANLETATMAQSVSSKGKGSSGDGVTTTITIPILTNTKTIQPGAELLVFRATKRSDQGMGTEDSASDDQPPPKVQKTAKGKGKQKGKGKGQSLRK